ncbi:hypothetical protein N9L68_05470 [bacterium]|nr:hypothetical protein [bacterium]
MMAETTATVILMMTRIADRKWVGMMRMAMTAVVVVSMVMTSEMTVTANAVAMAMTMMALDAMMVEMNDKW